MWVFFKKLKKFLSKFNIMIREWTSPFAKYLRTFHELISEFRLKSASSNTIWWSKILGFCPAMLANRLQNAHHCCGSPSLNWCHRTIRFHNSIETALTYPAHFFLLTLPSSIRDCRTTSIFIEFCQFLNGHFFLYKD